jgi:lipopolysaccharide transport system permease protein
MEASKLAAGPEASHDGAASGPKPRAPSEPAAAAGPALDSLPILRIEPSSGWVSLRLREVWDARELLYFLVWRDVKVRYKQTALGVAWALIQPLAAMLVFSIFFGRLAKMPSGGVPYPLFAYVGLVPWQLFSFALTESSNSLVNNKSLITKVYFPRILVPAASIVAGLVDFAISFVVLLGMMLFYGVVPTARVLALPLLVLFAAFAALAVGLWLAALNVKFRDVRYVIPFLTQFWLFATPIAYPAELVPPAYRVLYGLNPMVGVVEGFRWALLGAKTGIDSLMLGSVAAVMLLFFGGIAYFRRMEKYFADLV